MKGTERRKVNHTHIKVKTDIDRCLQKERRIKIDKVKLVLSLRFSTGGSQRQMVPRLKTQTDRNVYVAVMAWIKALAEATSLTGYLRNVPFFKS